MLAFSEGLLLAERDGIDPHLVAKVMTESAIGSPMLKARVPLVLDHPDETWFEVSLMRKDIGLALETGRQQDVPLPSAEVAGKILARAVELAYEHRDIAALDEVLGTDRPTEAR
jgi:3-hydroxyisobutyrate dehydrogenase-like beta-hydroxyacid dehydrogenase